MQSAFAKATESLECPPRKVITLRDEDWASTFQDRPVVPIKLGIRLLSLADQSTIRDIAYQALRESVEGTSDSQDAMQSAMLLATVSLAICNPKDARRCHEFFDCPNDKIPLALREETVKRIFDEVERLAVETSPIFSESTDDEIVDLCELLETDALTRLEETDPARAGRIRRYLDFVSEELNRE